jgi:hypothetical protein
MHRIDAEQQSGLSTIRGADDRSNPVSLDGQRNVLDALFFA